MHLGFKASPFVPHTLMPNLWSPDPSQKYQIAPKLRLLT